MRTAARREISTPATANHFCMRSSAPTRLVRTVSVSGLGYVGLPTAALFAEAGLQVSGVDISTARCRSIQRGVPESEPGLSEIIAQAIGQERFTLGQKPTAADAHLITVPTPLLEASKTADLRHVRDAARAIAPVLRTGDLVVLTSTSPVGTTQRLARWLAYWRPDLAIPTRPQDPAELHVAYCPERIRPGQALHELRSTDRVLGGITPACSDAAIALYARIAPEAQLEPEEARMAEMTKLAENSFRDVNIAFANELAGLCAEHGLDPVRLVAHANRHPRVGILDPGIGVGGHCIPVDPWFLAAAGRNAALLKTARQINDARPAVILDAILTALERLARRWPEAPPPTVAIYGLSYRADSDDLRNSPALWITQQLSREHTGKLIAVDPCLPDPPISSRISFATTPSHAESADLHVLLVPHQLFRKMPRPAGEVLDFHGHWS